MVIAKQKRMECGDYQVICAKELLRATGDKRTPPHDWLDLAERFFKDEWICNRTFDMAHEMFGECLYGESEPLLYKVEKLTLKESVIAARIDLTHTEKMELIKPLREKRETDSDGYWKRRQVKWDIEHQEDQQRREAEQEEQIVATVSEAMLISEDDQSWAASFGLSLN